MTSETDRNPSPPPEVLENDDDFVPDKIGDTMYSKRWVYGILMKLLKFVEDTENKDKEPSDNEAEKTEQESGDGGSSNIIELDSTIEADACTLWDMSANCEVCDFLCECGVAECFITIIEETQSPRLLEIIVGILGNMSSFNSTCVYISKNKKLVHSLILLSGCTDSCTLLQLFRLLVCCMANENCKEEWLKAIGVNLFFMKNVKCILENNLNRKVLQGCLLFLDRVLNESATYCSVWCSEPYIAATIEAGKQLIKLDEWVESFLSVVSTLCHTESGLKAYAKHFDSIKPMFHAYFYDISRPQSFPPSVSKADIISSNFMTYGNLIHSYEPDKKFCGDKVCVTIVRFFRLVDRLIKVLDKRKSNENKETEDKPGPQLKTKERNNSDDDEKIEKDLVKWRMLYEAIIHAMNAILDFDRGRNTVCLDMAMKTINREDFEFFENEFDGIEFWYF